MRNSVSKLGSAVKAARKNRNLTQMELSEELGITPRYLQAIENESKTPNYELLTRILSYLNIPADNLFTPYESEISKEQEQLLYLIMHKCSKRDVFVLLSTAKALVEEVSPY